MSKIYRLKNQIKHYEWGSSRLLPQFLNIENSREVPYAEMWMGTHSGAPSQIQLIVPGDKKRERFITLSEISGELPFLLKLLAVEKQLSIQAHPNKEQAASGYRQEEELQLPLNSPRRIYKDSNHKPEIICAISPFSLMAGFKDFEIIKKSLEEFVLMLPQLKEIISPMLKSLDTGLLAVFFRVLTSLSKIEREYLSTLILEKNISDTSGVISAEQWKLMKSFAALYPEDPAIISPLYLNLLTLQPGQAIYVPAGILHSYVSGFGVELMTASDNVLRGGLTPKYINIPQLMGILNFQPYLPLVLNPDSQTWFCYHTPCKEFLLALMRGQGSEKAFPVKGPAICIVTEGELVTGDLIFKKGESFFIPKDTDESSLFFNGNYSLFAAFSDEA